MVNHTIDIPRVVVVPKGEVSYGYTPFMLNLSGLHLQPSERDIVIHSLQTNEQNVGRTSGFLISKILQQTEAKRLGGAR